MRTRTLGRTGRTVSAIGLGTWQLGADWGEVSAEDAMAVLDAAADAGVSVFDTADVYGDGRSERLIGRVPRASNPGLEITVATKMGRRERQDPANFTLRNFRQWTDRSRRNLGSSTRPGAVALPADGRVRLETRPSTPWTPWSRRRRSPRTGSASRPTDEALAAIARPRVATVQIILNAFRLKPLDAVLPAAIEAGVGIIARVPLASGLLSGKYTAATTFAANDHRNFNRHGEAFDVGETFSGVDYATGVVAAQEFAALAAGHPARPRAGPGGSGLGGSAGRSQLRDPRRPHA